MARAKICVCLCVQQPIAHCKKQESTNKQLQSVDSTRTNNTDLQITISTTIVVHAVYCSLQQVIYLNPRLHFGKQIITTKKTLFPSTINSLYYAQITSLRSYTMVLQFSALHMHLTNNQLVLNTLHLYTLGRVNFRCPPNSQPRSPQFPLHLLKVLNEPSKQFRLGTKHAVSSAPQSGKHLELMTENLATGIDWIEAYGTQHVLALDEIDGAPSLQSRHLVFGRLWVAAGRDEPTHRSWAPPTLLWDGDL